MYFVVQVSKLRARRRVSGKTKFDIKSCHVKSLLANSRAHERGHDDENDFVRIFLRQVLTWIIASRYCSPRSQLPKDTFSNSHGVNPERNVDKNF